MSTVQYFECTVVSTVTHCSLGGLGIESQ